MNPATKSVAAILLMIYTAVATGDEIYSCYTAQDRIQDMSSAEERYEIVTSIFKVKGIEKDRIQFYLNSYGGNFSKCSAPGFANKIDANTYIFIDKEEFWSEKGWELYSYLPASVPDEKRCILTITFGEGSVSVKAAQYRCNNFCGNHGDFNRTYMAAEDRKPCDNKL